MERPGESVRLPRPGRPEAAILMALFLAHAVTLIVWLRADAVPNGFQNEFHHLRAAQWSWSLLADGRLGALLAALFTDYYPPLLNAQGLVALTLIPGAEDWLAATSLVWVALLLVSTWALAEIVVPRGGVAAAVLVSALPAIVGNARYFEPNTALAALCTAAVLALACAGSGKSGWLLAGAVGGGALLADRLTAAPVLLGALGFVLGPLLVGPGTDRSTRWTAARRLAWFALPAAALILPWFVCWCLRWLPEIVAQLGGEITYSGEHTEHRSLADPLTWLYYPLTLVDSQAGLVAGPLALAGGAWLLVRERSPGARALQGALAFTVFFISVVLKKQAYYSHPILPLAAISVVWLAWRLPWPAARWGVVGIATLASLVQTLDGSWVARPLPNHRLWTVFEEPVPRGWVEPRYPQTDKPDHLGREVDELADWILAQGWTEQQGPVVVHAETQVLYEHALVTMLRLRLRSARVEVASESADFAAVVPTARWFVYGSMTQEQTWPTEGSIDALLEQQGLINELGGSLPSALAAMRPRAELRRSWVHSEHEFLHVHALR